MTKSFDEKSALALVMQLMAIRGPSCEETAVADAIVSILAEMGIERSTVQFDTAHRRTPRPGAIGNLIVKLPGDNKRPRIMLSAHMDTVPVCLGAQPKKVGGKIISADKSTGLGADDRAGIAAVLVGLREGIRSGVTLPPLTLCFFVQEEIGLQGSRNLSAAKLGKVAMAYNFDGGSPAKLTIGATGGERLKIVLHGQTAHAGLAPEAGASAIHAAGLAIARLQKAGWLGAVRKGKLAGTSNIGVIHGGVATNVVADRVEIDAEARSHDGPFRDRIASEIEQAFVEEAAKIVSRSGNAVRAEVSRRVDYESFRLADDSPVVEVAKSAVKACGLEPITAVSNGGVDANWLVKHGIPTVTLGCGQRDVHTQNESLDIADYLAACRIAKALIEHAA
ncbi:MAG: M20/M25/M40 family metallo-hydrolase [Pirellulales bacterium]